MSNSRAVWVYVICDHDADRVKVGISNDVARRLLSLQPGNPNRLKAVHTFLCKDRDTASKIERQFHEAHGDEFGMCGEWFGMTPDLAAVKIQEILWGQE